jgi:Fe-S-cluster containining protein
MLNLHVPEGINYECSGCGHCCLGWPVPLTTEDYVRICEYEESAAGGASGARAAMRALDGGSDPALTKFTHSLEKRADGRCEFLTEDDRCRLHVEAGPQMKPTICQLFPYNFTETPSGIYASVSFVSSAALFNAGRPLSEQNGLLEQKWEQFRRVFPEGSRNWSEIQLFSGQPLKWDEYLQMDSRLLELLRAEQPEGIERRLAACSRYLVRQAPRGVDFERMPPVEARPKVVDQLLVKWLMEFYLTEDVYACSSFDLYSQALFADCAKPPPAVMVADGDAKCSFNQLLSFELGLLEPDSEDLLSRFVYNKVFGKLYFGAGLAGLSVLGGIHHLLWLIALIRLKAKILCISQERTRLDFQEWAEIVRTLERRLTRVTYSAESTFALEILITSPERVGRILTIAR